MKAWQFQVLAEYLKPLIERSRLRPDTRITGHDRRREPDSGQYLGTVKALNETVRFVTLAEILLMTP